MVAVKNFMDKILFSGGSGLLGKHLVPLLERHKPEYKVICPTHQEMDLTKRIKPIEGIDLIIHAAAYTDVELAEYCPRPCFNVNAWGTERLIGTYPDTPLLYISTEYAKKPVNVYAVSKLLGELVVKANCRHYLIIRTLFKPDIWEWDNAFVDQWTMGDTVSVIAPLIAKRIKRWNRKSRELVYIGTGRKNIYSLAKKSRPDVSPSSVKDVKTVVLPSDYL